MATVVDVLRHGALEGGVRYRGGVEARLTPEGRAAMDAVWERLRDEVEVIVSSPLSRCLAPARDWAKTSGKPLVVEPDFRELAYGEWEGCTHEEIEARFPGMLAAWRRDPSALTIPGAETWAGFAGRVAGAWRRLLEAHEGRHVLLVAHSGTLRALLAMALEAPAASARRLDVPYACWSRLSHADGNSVLIWHNRRPDG